MPELETQRWLDRVAQNGWALGSAAAELRGDREIVLAAVAQEGSALEYASADLKSDREIVLAAVAQDGSALEYASADLKGDPSLRKLQSINPQLSAIQLVAELRLHLACAFHERLGAEAMLKSLPLEVIEQIGKHVSIRLAVHGLMCRPY